MFAAASQLSAARFETTCKHATVSHNPTENLVVQSASHCRSLRSCVKRGVYIQKEILACQDASSPVHKFDTISKRCQHFVHCLRHIYNPERLNHTAFIQQYQQFCTVPSLPPSLPLYAYAYCTKVNLYCTKIVYTRQCTLNPGHTHQPTAQATQQSINATRCGLNTWYNCTDQR